MDRRRRLFLTNSAALGGVSYSAEATALFAAMDVQPSAARKSSYNTLITTLKAQGLWDKTDVLHLYAAHDAQAGRLNIKSPSTFAATEANSPTFETDRGYTGNASTSYLSTTFNPATAGGVFVQNSGHIGCWSRTDNGGASALCGNSGTGNTFLAPDLTGTFFYGVNSSQSVAGTDKIGHFVASRRDSTDIEAYRNAVSVQTVASASAAPVSLPVYIGARADAADPPIQFSPEQIAAFHIGSGLTDTNVTDFYNALLAYLQDVGAA